MNIDAEAFRRLQPLEYYAKFLHGDDASSIGRGERPDGRSTQAYRKAAISVSPLDGPQLRVHPPSGGDVLLPPTALPSLPGDTRLTWHASSVDSSVLVRCGGTTIIAGVSCTPVPPSTDITSLFDLEVTLPPLAAPRFARTGRAAGCIPSSDALAVMLKELLRTGVRALRAPELEPFLWRVHCDLYCTTFDGNVVDAAIVAATVALACLTPPPCVRSDSGVPQLCDATPRWRRDVTVARRVTSHAMPVAVTFAVIDTRPLGSTSVAHVASQHAVCVADPTGEEEAVACACFTLVVDAASDAMPCVAVHMWGGDSVPTGMQEEAMHVVRARAAALAPAMREAIDSGR